MAADLIWGLLKGNNRFVVKRSGKTFSTEPGNLTGKNTLASSGLANKKVVRIEAAKEGGVVVSHRAVSVGSNKVANAFTKPAVMKRHSARRAAAAVATDLKASYYRHDLIAKAAARAKAIVKSQQKKKAVSKKMRANKAARLAGKN